MNKKVLVFAGIFLAIAVISPIFFYFEELSHFQTDLKNLGPNLADETQATEYFNFIAQRHTLTLAIFAVIEVISVILFAVALWFALKP